MFGWIVLLALLISGHCRIPKLSEILCWIPMLAWPVVGYFQGLDYITTKDCNPCHAICIFILPSFTGCIGAAINKAWIKGKLDRQCPRDLFLFSLHIWNSCLLDVGKACECLGLDK